MGDRHLTLVEEPADRYRDGVGPAPVDVVVVFGGDGLIQLDHESGRHVELDPWRPAR